MAKIQCAIIGPGNIGADLMIKVMRMSKNLEMGAMVGIDPASDGLARAARLNVPTTHEGIEGLRKLPNYKDIKVVFDATSAGAHIKNNAILQKDGKKVIDLTPAAIGPFTIPVINGDANIDEPNVNMVTCGGQATIPMVYAVKRATKRVIWGEIVASISSKSAGPGTRAIAPMIGIVACPPQVTMLTLVTLPSRCCLRLSGGTTYGPIAAGVRSTANLPAAAISGALCACALALVASKIRSI